MKLDIQIDASKPKAKMQRLPDDVKAEMLAAARVLDRELVSYAQLLASGGLVNVKTGRYVRSIKGSVTSGAKTVTGKVYSRAPEAHLVEFGAVRGARDILPNTRKALAFMMGGNLTFARKVRYPGSTMRGRHVLETAINDMKEEIAEKMKAAVQVGLNK